MMGRIDSPEPEAVMIEFENGAGKRATSSRRPASRFPWQKGIAMSRCKRVTVVIFMLCSAVFAGGVGFVNAAEQGTLDTTFGIGGKVVIPFDLVSGGADFATAVAVQQDGKIIVVGGAERLGLDVDFAVLRLEQDGDLDPTFSGDGKMTVSFNLTGSFTDWATAVAIQPDGAIVVAGRVDGKNDNLDFGIVRLDTDGDLDPTFGGGGMTTVGFELGGAKDDLPWAVAVQDDGKVLVAGAVDGSLGNDDFGVLRLTSSGEPDVGFGLNGIRVVFFDLGGSNDEEVRGLAVQPTGEILLVGPVTMGWGDVEMGAVRLLSSSITDTTFGTGGLARVGFDFVGDAVDLAFALALQDDGKIVLAGAAEKDGGNRDFAVARLGTDGVLDDTFSADGKTTEDFDLGGTEEDVAYGVTLEPDGRIVVAGQVDGPSGDKDFGVARFESNGALDETFGSSGTTTVSFDLGGAEDVLSDLAVPPTGGVFLVGAVDVTAGGTDFGVAKVHGVTVFGDGFETGDTNVWSNSIP
jgi:uncharacterized delta-60 repeat protein